MGRYRISLEQFSGPLDLLWHLIRTEEMDVLDLDVARITEEYVRFIEVHGVQNLTEAYNFLAMAASLVELKSRLLLPPVKGEGESDGDLAADDPRQELVQRLVAFRSIQDVTEELERRFEETGRHWPRQVIEQIEAEIAYSMGSLSAYDLMAVFNDVLTRPRYQHVSILREPYGLEEARADVKERLSRGPAALAELLGEQPDTLALIVTFLAVLELIKEETVAFEKREGELVVFTV
ncbi:MAG: segregation/condensation protein A [bacterium]|nr:segregation/condensation protein A [bacterium]